MADTQEPQGTSSAATEPSTHEWDAQADSFFGGDAQPTGGDESFSPLEQLVVGGQGTQAKPKPTGNPVWRAVLALGRGANEGVNNTLSTIAEASVESQSTPLKKMALRNTAFYGPFADAVASRISTAVGNDPKQAAQVGINSQEELNAVYGPKPTDGLGSFFHGLGQWASGTLMLTAGVGPWAAGALSAGTAFKPHEDTLAEVGHRNRATLRKIPVLGPALANIAYLLSSDETDSVWEARAKNVLEGEGLGQTLKLFLKPVIAGVRAMRAKTPAASAAPVANPTDVVEVVTEADGTIAVQSRQIPREPVATNGGRPSIDAGRFQEEVASFVDNEGIYRGGADVPAPDLEIRPPKPMSEVISEAPIQPGESAMRRAPLPKRPELVRVELAPKGGNVVEIKTLESLVEAERAGHATKVMEKLIRAADKHGVVLTLTAQGFGKKALTPGALRNFYRKFGFEQASGSEHQMVRRPGDAAPDFRESPTAGGERSVPTSTVDVMKEVKELGLEADVRAEAAMRGTSAADVEHAARTVLHEHYNRRTLKAAAEPHPAPVRIVYSDAAAAHSDAATINAVAYEDMRAASRFTPDETALHFETAQRLRNGDIGSLTTSPHFNLQSMGTSLDVDAQIQAVTTQYSDLFSVTQGRPSVPNEVLHDAAAQWAGQVQLDNFLPAMARADVAGRVDLSLKAALYNAAMKQAGQEVAEIGMLLAAKQGDDALMDLSRRRLQTFFNVSEATANFNSELGRGLQATSARGAESAAGIRFGSNVQPRPSIMRPKGPVTPPGHPPISVAAMSPQQVASMVRLFARSGGDARVVAHVVDAMRKAAKENAAEWAAKPHGGWTGKNAEQLSTLFVSSIISGFKTFATIALSGASMNAFRATAKVISGVGSANRGLAEEGAAQWYSLFVHSRYAIRGAWGAFKENRSILDGTPPFHVDPSKIMKGVAVPGRIAGALDEFTRTAAYRADEFAAAFRQARDEGLELVDAVKRAEFDMKQSVDEATGIAVNPVALRRAGIPTLSDNLGTDTFMGKISNTMAQYPLTKFAVPFIRPSVNTFRWAWANTPVLNKYSREAQEVFLKGGEEATVLHTQAALTGSMMVYAMSKVMDSEITGAGPKDPTLRRMWGKQPYSIKMPDGKWRSYRRTEPFATFLGMVADTYEIYGEVPDQDKDAFDEKVQSAMGAVFAAATRNVTSKSWTESLLNFFSALDDKDGHAVETYLRGVARGLIPYSSALKSFSDDPVWREVRSVVDGVRATVPGYSETLPANYDWSGNVEAKQGSLWNRNFSVYPEHEAEEGVEDVLIDNFIRLAPPNPRPFRGIDMHDKQWALPDGRTPYMVFMEKLKATGVRQMVEAAVKDPSFTEAPKGTSAYPNSIRNDIISAIVGGQTESALWSMLSEFQGAGGFADAYINARYVVPNVAKGMGEEAADSVKGLYGINTSVRR